MHILVTNDDGITAPGLLALAQSMRRLGQVTVLAPDRNWSACGHVKTLDRPLRVRDTTLADGSAALMHLDLTAHQTLPTLNQWTWEMSS